MNAGIEPRHLHIVVKRAYHEATHPPKGGIVFLSLQWLQVWPDQKNVREVLNGPDNTSIN